jgi:hypothetical protein
LHNCLHFHRRIKNWALSGFGGRKLDERHFSVERSVLSELQLFKVIINFSGTNTPQFSINVSLFICRARKEPSTLAQRERGQMSAPI